MYKNIFLVRHGRSQSNEDKQTLETTPDFQHHLVKNGVQQALDAGQTLNKLLKENGSADFIVSPYYRTLETFILMKVRISPHLIVSEVEDHRVREREWEGSFKPHPICMQMLKDSQKYNSFFARLPHGESGADVMERINSLWADQQIKEKKARNLVIVAHAFTNRIIETKLKGLSVWEFPNLMGMKNGEVRQFKI